MRGVAKDYYETLAVRERELSDQRTAKERLKERCVRMREKIENLQAKMKRNQKPSKWHQRFIRRLKGTWRSD
jgi:phage shock protein A